MIVEHGGTGVWIFHHLCELLDVSSSVMQPQAAAHSLPHQQDKGENWEAESQDTYGLR